MEIIYSPPVERTWQLLKKGVTESNYFKPQVKPWLNTVRDGMSEWEGVTPYECFMMQLPPLELEKWAMNTTRKFLMEGKVQTTVKEIKAIVGILLASTQGPKRGVLGILFSTENNGLFPACKIQRFGMSQRRFWEVWSAFTCEMNPVDIENSDPYWPINGIISRFNEHYSQVFTCGWKVVVDESMWWHHCINLPKTMKVGRKPRDTGSEVKCLADTITCVIVAVELVRDKTIHDQLEFCEGYGASAAVVLRLFQHAKIFGSKRTVIADSDFGNLRLACGLRKNGLHVICMVKGGYGGFPKSDLVQTLEPKKRGEHTVATLKVGEHKLIGLAWRGKSDKIKGEKRKNHYISTFLATECTTTLAGPPAEKKRHLDGVRVASVFVPRPKLVADYYGDAEVSGMPAIDINNKLRQYCLGIEEAVRTFDPWKRMICSIIGTWETNAWNMHTHFSEAWRLRKKNDRGAHAEYVRSIILGGLFPHPADEVAAGEPVESLSGTRSSRVDPYVHTMYTFKEVGGGIARQQRCVLCIAEKKKTKSLTAFYCGLCATTAIREEERKPTKHAYCVDSKRQCFTRHIAACFRFQSCHNQIPQRNEARPLAATSSVAGPMFVYQSPKKNRRGKANERKKSRK